MTGAQSSSLGFMALGAAVASLSAGPAAGQALAHGLAVASDPQPFGVDDLLWMEVRTSDAELAESMNVYASRAGVFLPLGEFSRVLDLAVGVFPTQKRAEGWILSPDRPLIIDLPARRATLAGREIAFSQDQAVLYDDDLYVRADLLERLLPVKIKTDRSAQVLTVTPTEALPFQQRLARERRRAQQVGATDEAALRIDTPYRLFTPPAFDVNIGGQMTRDGVDQARRYDVRAAGDLLGAGFEGYVGSDNKGQVNDLRVLFSRKDPDGHALGPLGGTRAGLGDVYSPSMPIGAAGVTGRGVFYSSAPLEALDLATPLDLRGELAVGEEVELYVNEILQAAQTSPDQGRYQFLNVPLAYGLNTIRLVFYGPQGQSREVVRRINFGAGQVEAGRLVVRMGAVQQGRTVFDVGDRVRQPGDGEPRMVLTADYGLSPSLTASIGVARFTPGDRQTRSLLTAGLRGAFGPVAAQIDAAVDDRGGRGVTVGAAARPLGVSVVARHSEYSGGFVDETRQPGVTTLALLTRATDLRADGQIPLRGGLGVPVSLNLRRQERVNGDRLTNAELRAAAPIGRFYVSSSALFEGEKSGGVSRKRWFGSTDLSTLVSSRVQVRGGASYQISPEWKVDAAYATADWRINDRNTLRLGVVRTMGPAPETSYQASHLWRAKRFDLAVNLSYDAEAREWRIGVQLGFGLRYDPFSYRYRLSRPGVANGGSAAINAWIDENGDGIRQPDEAALPKLVAETPGGPAETDMHGRAIAIGLGDNASARIRLNPEAVDDPFLVAGGASTVEIVPRPGRTAVIDYPMQRTAEVELTAKVVRDDAPARGLAALNVELVPRQSGAILKGRSDHAGVLYFEGVRRGVYDLRIDPAQASGLGLSLASPVTVVVTASGLVRGGDVLVRVKGKPSQ
ncbi:hypothetical protein [Caulobacter mirabilis]|nr:hypothetical protein [Caulobacter mirabilis]